MRFSRFAVIALLAVTIVSGTSCSYYNRIIARKNLVDGSNAYKGRNFNEAERLFREAVALDPNGETTEGKTAQLFLARTLHSQFIGNRSDTSKAEEAIVEYQKALSLDEADQSSYKAIASLYENLQKSDLWLEWVTKRSTNANIPPEQRAEALTSLAAKKYSCANDITDTEATKKQIAKDGKPAYQHVKPADPAELERLRQCIAEGTQLIDQAIALESDSVKNAANFDVKGASDGDLKEHQDLFKVFESARSYKTNLLFQSSFLAEMEGRNDDSERFKKQADSAKAEFLGLSDVGKKIQAEIDARIAAEKDEGNANANSQPEGN